MPELDRHRRLNLNPSWRLPSFQVQKELAAPQGFEPQLTVPETGVLPLDHGAEQTFKLWHLDS